MSDKKAQQVLKELFIRCRKPVIRRNPSLETRAACTGFSIQFNVHVQT